jgi:hypothetical protein
MFGQVGWGSPKDLPLISGPASHGAADGLRHGGREERSFDGIRHRRGPWHLVPLSTDATGRGGGFQSEFLDEWWPALGSLVGDVALRAEHPQVGEHHVAFMRGADANVIKGRRPLPQLRVPHCNVVGIVLEYLFLGLAIVDGERHAAILPVLSVEEDQAAFNQPPEVAAPFGVAENLLGWRMLLDAHGPHLVEAQERKEQSALVPVVRELLNYEAAIVETRQLIVMRIIRKILFHTIVDDLLLVGFESLHRNSRRGHEDERATCYQSSRQNSAHTLIRHRSMVDWRNQAISHIEKLRLALIPTPLAGLPSLARSPAQKPNQTRVGGDNFSLTV